MLLQVFLERDVNFHLGRRNQPNLCSHQSTAVFCFLGKSEVFAHFSVSLLALQTLSAHQVPLWDQWFIQGPWELSWPDLDVTETGTCQGQITVPCSALAMAEH